ncbi:MAG TPA: HAMP domain-containing sensor histidine kinase [Thermoanaerobaculia bacterium]|nr:HAMP domain-containing sensor histidine kinase [Thermoanaerobaculia bacterium]
MQRGLLLLALYLLGVAALAWWANEALDAAATAVMDDTAHLVASEVAAALDEDVVSDLLGGDPGNRVRLLNQIFTLTRRSAMVRSVQVVDEHGEIFASSEFVSVGSRVATPDQLFDGRRDPRLLAERGEGPRARAYVLAMPLRRSGRLVGYLRLELDSSRLAVLYTELRRRLLMGAVAGLVLVAGVAYGLHLQLQRRSVQLVAALEQAAAGGLPGGGAGDLAAAEFAPALAVAGRLGRELQQERRRNLQADRRLQRLAGMMDVGLLLLSRDLQVEFASEHARELLGLPEQPGAEDWRTALAPLEGILQQPPVDRTSGLQADLEVTRLKRERRIRCQVFPLDEEGNAGYLVQLRDKELVQAIETDLRLAAQLRALTRVYRGVAHDLRAPLNAMVLNLELLRRSLDPAAPPRPDLADKQQRWLSIIEQELQRLRRALDVLLAQTAPPSEKAEAFDLRGVLEEIQALLYPQARQQRIELDSRVPEGEVTVVALRDQVKQSVLNIAINGLEAMPDGGKLGLSLERDTDKALVRVSDTGPGIPPELCDRIFDMHFTTKQSGTGIGLYVARSMFESQGGSLRTASSGPEGTTFELTLPLPRQGR